jgi:diguanylate cyclase (GGDEF)-like protein
VETVRVCVADDNREAADVLCEGLRNNEYEAVAAADGNEALEVCRTQAIDILLLDVCMPGMDGYEVCRQIKADPETRDIEVIFVTVKGSQEDVDRAFELGARDFITKPFNLPMVMVRVDAAARQRGAGQLLDEGDAVAEAFTDSETGLYNRGYLLRRLDEEVEKAGRYNYPMSFVVFDVDDVQPVDEEVGGVGLEEVLPDVALCVRRLSRTADVLARYDGSQLAAILPHCSVNDAICYAGKILGEVDATTFSDPNFPTVARMSIGITTCQNGSAESGESVLGTAMQCLLQAKSLGSDRVVARDLSGATPV